MPANDRLWADDHQCLGGPRKPTTKLDQKGSIQLVSLTRPHTCRRRRIICWRRIAFSASSRPFALNGKAKADSTIQTKANMATEPRRFARATNQDAVFGTQS
jgi:hypothetical protein